MYVLGEYFKLSSFIIAIKTKSIFSKNWFSKKSKNIKKIIKIKNFEINK